MFITFEGGEGSGKTTQIRLLQTFLQQRGIASVLTREPGGTVGAEEIRALLLRGDTDRWDALSELFLFSAARRDHLTRVIWPALKKGETVICDRFADSTLVYQGYCSKTPERSMAQIQAIYKMLAGDFQPDLTVILDIDVKTGLARSIARAGNDEQRFERKAVDFHETVRSAFLDIAEKNPARCVVINADDSKESIHAQIVQAVLARIK